jgi:hypothetical protein
MPDLLKVEPFTVLNQDANSRQLHTACQWPVLARTLHFSEFAAAGSSAMRAVLAQSERIRSGDRVPACLTFGDGFSGGTKCGGRSRDGRRARTGAAIYHKQNAQS